MSGTIAECVTFASLTGRNNIRVRKKVPREHGSVFFFDKYHTYVIPSVNKPNKITRCRCNVSTCTEEKRFESLS